MFIAVYNTHSVRHAQKRDTKYTACHSKVLYLNMHYKGSVPYRILLALKHDFILPLFYFF